MLSYFSRPWISILWLYLCVLTSCLEQCGQWANFEPNGGPYWFSNDGWADDGSGFSCMTIADNATAFAVEWSWTDSPYQTHGFPHISANSPSLPVQLQYISSLNLRANFTSYLSLTRDSNPSSQQNTIQSSGVRSNIAVDMFADPDPLIAFANTTTRTEFEIMIWVSQTQAIHPVGSQSSHDLSIANTTFTLWSGQSPNGQTTFSWLAPVTADLQYIDADYSPLLHYLWQTKLLPSDVYLGSVQFGSETFYSGGVNVTFEASGYAFEVLKDITQQLPPLSIPASSDAHRLGVRLLSSVPLLLLMGALFCS